jgi:acylphosphatase
VDHLRLAITVNGRVQGVGFRFFTMIYANKKHLTGWVRNRSDGAVEMEVQGSPEDLDAFKKMMRDGPVLARVKDVTVIELPVLEGEAGFSVRH